LAILDKHLAISEKRCKTGPGIVTMAHKEELKCALSNGAISSDLE